MTIYHPDTLLDEEVSPTVVLDAAGLDRKYGRTEDPAPAHTVVLFEVFAPTNPAEHRARVTCSCGQRALAWREHAEDVFLTISLMAMDRLCPGELAVRPGSPAASVRIPDDASTLG